MQKWQIVGMLETISMAKDQKEEPVMYVGKLAKTYTEMLMIKAAMSQGLSSLDISKTLRINQFRVEKYMQKLRDKNAIGELNHPSESVIDLGRVAMNIVELHWEGHTLVGKLEIITSPGFRKYGIISCQGDQTANLLLEGIKIGVSSRGLGTVTQKMGVLYVGDDYEIVCWDVVSDPSTPNAWITPENEIPQVYIEGKEEDKDKNPIFEKLNKFGDWLND